MIGPVRWVDASGKLAEVVFTTEEIERLKGGKAVTSYSPSHPVARWQAAEALPHLERRIGEIEREQRDLPGE